MFIEEHRDVFGVGPICRVLPIAPSSFYAVKTVERDLDPASDRAKRDKRDDREIERVFKDNRSCYGVRKVWHQLRR